MFEVYRANIIVLAPGIIKGTYCPATVMDLAESRLIRKVVIKEWGAEVFRKIGPCPPSCESPLKGQCHEICCFGFFSWITLPQAPENNIRVISNFFEISRRYLQVMANHRCQQYRQQILPPWPLVLLARYRWQIATGVNDTGRKFATGAVSMG